MLETELTGASNSMGSMGLLFCAAAICGLGLVLVVRSVRASARFDCVAQILAGALLMFLGGWGIHGALGIPRANTLIVTQTNLKSLHYALRLYYDENRAFPPSLSLLVQKRYLTAHQLHSLFRSDVAHDQGQFIYVRDLQLADPPNWPLIVDPHEPKDPERTIAYLDGEVRTVPKAQFDAVMTEFKDAYRAKYDKPPDLEMPVPPEAVRPGDVIVDK